MLEDRAGSPYLLGLTDLRREAFDGPVVVVGFRIQESVVDSVAAALPEFDSLGLDSVAAPERGEGDIAVFEFAFHLGELGFEERAGRDDAALLGGPGPDPAAERARDEIFERLGGRYFLGGAGDRDLAVDAHPGEE